MKRCAAMTPFATPLPAYRDMTFKTVERYWTDPEYRARCEAERQHGQALLNAGIDTALIASGNRWPAHWTDAEKQHASAKAGFEGDT